MAMKTNQQGGVFLFEDVLPEDVFTPEDFSETHLMIARITDDFARKEAQPFADKLEHKDLDMHRKLMAKAGAIGLLGADIKEEFGGSGMDKISSALIGGHFVAAAALGTTLNCHTGIGSLPLVFFGNKAQKMKYLPGLAAGTSIGAYALTEPSAGSDALSIKTTAKLSPDGKYYILNGEKQFITNGGIADIIFTYAKVDGEKFTAFIVEKAFKGVSTGPEEKKMGVRGSSTTPVIFQDVMVPVENVLFEIGQGHLVAFCILDMGRFKLGSPCTELAKLAIEPSVKYAKQRKQFGKPLSDFGLIKQKLAEMAINTYIGESVVYRTADLIDKVMADVDMATDSGRELAKRVAAYTIECSITKVFCSEMLGIVADEALQIHGGYGYIEDYGIERIYRDARINRIWEGTNEINRLVILDTLLRMAVKNEIPLFAAAQKLAGELISISPVSPSLGDGLLGYQKKLISMAKKIFILVCSVAVQKYGKAIKEEQEILGLLSNIVINIYAMESGLLRAQKTLAKMGEEKARLKIDMTQVYVNEAMRKIEDYGTQILVSVETGDVLATQLGVLKKLARLTPINTVAAKRRIANDIITAEKFVC